MWVGESLYECVWQQYFLSDPISWLSHPNSNPTMKTITNSFISQILFDTEHSQGSLMYRKRTTTVSHVKHCCVPEQVCLPMEPRHPPIVPRLGVSPLLACRTTPVEFPPPAEERIKVFSFIFTPYFPNCFDLESKTTVHKGKIYNKNCENWTCAACLDHELLQMPPICLPCWIFLLYQAKVFRMPRPLQRAFVNCFAPRILCTDELLGVNSSFLPKKKVYTSKLGEKIISPSSR